jgi:GNAT superfamily N-acetyltransferase
MSLRFREAVRADSAVLASLSAELGYPVSAAEIEARLALMRENPDHAVLVACDAGAPGAGRGAGSELAAAAVPVIGWIDVGIVFHLQSGRFCEIGGLVVTASARRRGAGKALVAQAEKWAADKGLTRVLVRSNAVREDAHRFYLREGYRRTKTSAVFEKAVGAPAAETAPPTITENAPGPRSRSKA